MPPRGPWDHTVCSSLIRLEAVAVQAKAVMRYEIVIIDVVIDPGVELIHDHPQAARLVFECMCETFGPAAVAILRDGQSITAAQLTADIGTYEIQLLIEQDTLLPSTYRHGRGGDSDLAIGTDGYAHAVDKPPNPEDDWA